MDKKPGNDKIKDGSPKVSVVILTYNQEKTIARTLDSVLAQEVDFPIEILIGDDASTDNTEKVCREYAEKYPQVIRYVRNKCNKGILDNYYDILLMANGEYIADVAGDDFWINNNKLKLQAKILDAEKDVSLVCTDWTYFNEAQQKMESPWSDGKYPYKDLFEETDLTKSLFKKRNPVAVHLCTAMYRREAFVKLYQKDSYPFRNKEFIVEDLQMIILLSTVGKFRFLELCTLAYSVHPESVTSTKDFRKLFDVYFGSLKLNRYLIEKTGNSHKEFLTKYQRIVHYLLMLAFHSGDKERRDKIMGLTESWGLKLPMKTKIIKNLSSNSLLWKASKGVWQTIRPIKN